MTSVSTDTDFLRAVWTSVPVGCPPPAEATAAHDPTRAPRPAGEGCSRRARPALHPTPCAPTPGAPLPVGLTQAGYSLTVARKERAMTRPAEPDAHRPAPPYNCDRCGRRAHPTWLRFDVTLSLAEGDGKTPRATARFLGLPSGRAWTRVLIVAKRGLGGCRAQGHATPRLGATAVGRQRASGRCEGRARACLRATGRGRRAGAQRGDEAANAQSPAAVNMLRHGPDLGARPIEYSNVELYTRARAASWSAI